jgi:hypothetical protein
MATDFEDSTRQDECEEGGTVRFSEPLYMRGHQPRRTQGARSHEVNAARDRYAGQDDASHADSKCRLPQ